MRKRTLYALAFMVCSGLLANGQIIGSGQTIADIARRERARVRGTEPAKPPSFTSQTIKSKKGDGLDIEPPDAQPPNSAPAAAPKAEEQKAAAAGAEAAPAAATPEVRDEKWWRGRFDVARADVQRKENEVAVMESNLRKANVDSLQTSYDPGGQARKNVAEATTRLDAAKKDLEQARAKIPQLEEELRRTGAPASWAR